MTVRSHNWAILESGRKDVKCVGKEKTATVLSDASISPLAGKPAPRKMLVDLARLEKEYFDRKPDLEDANQLVAFGTSGHRGSSQPIR